MGKYKINWVKEPRDGRDWSWLESIFCKLGHYYDDYAKNIAEMPFNYTERTILGSLAIAADRCNYYTFLDYSTETKKGYRYPDFWITMEPRQNSYDVVFEAKRFAKYSFETYNKRFSESVTRRIKGIHEKLNNCGMGETEKVNFQCALLAFQFRIDGDKRNRFDNNSYDEKWHKLYGDQEKQKRDNSKWPDEESQCSFWYLYWVPFSRIRNPEFKKHYWETPDTRLQYRKPALGLLIIGSFREVK